MHIVDCDCHNDWHSAEAILPYLDGWWKECFERGEKTGPTGSFPHAHRAWFHPEGFRRADIKPTNQEEHYTLMRDRHLDQHGINVAILTGEDALEVSTLANPYYAMALASAYNDYIIKEWLPRDERFYGSIMIAPQDPALAAKEIYRLGSHPRLVQALASQCSLKPYGDPFYHPIYRACEEVGLPFATHLGGTGGINTAAFAGGAPRYFVEAHALFPQIAQTQVVSMIMNGVFEQYPALKVIFIEGGFTWVAPLIWRLDSEWKALRKETPWVKRLPSEYCAEHIRFTTQPMDQAPNEEHMWALMEAMNGRKTLMFASDYPHWDQDDPLMLRFPDGWQPDILGGNALKTYTRLPAPAAQMKASA